MRVDVEPSPFDARRSLDPSDPNSYETVDAASWCVVELTAIDDSGSPIEISLLRPRLWMSKQGVRAGQFAEVDLSKHVLLGPALVTAVEECPVELDGQYLVGTVTGLVRAGCTGDRGRD